MFLWWLWCSFCCYALVTITLMPLLFCFFFPVAWLPFWFVGGFLMMHIDSWQQAQAALFGTYSFLLSLRGVIQSLFWEQFLSSSRVGRKNNLSISCFDSILSVYHMVDMLRNCTLRKKYWFPSEISSFAEYTPYMDMWCLCYFIP